MKLKTVCLLLALTWISSTQMVNAQNIPTPRLTPAQVIQLASNFCQSINQPVTANATTTYPALNPVADELPTYWQDRWQVTFPDQAQLEIVDATGVVSDYVNRTYSQYLLDNINKPLSSMLLQSQAIQSATVALQASGQAEMLSDAGAKLVQHNDPNNPHVGDAIWEILWTRQAQNFPYKNDFAITQLDAGTGKIIGFSLSFSSPPLLNFSVSISQDQALGIAQARMTSAGFPNAALDTGVPLSAIQLSVLQPNSFWQDSNEQPLPGNSHLAWIFRFILTTYEEYREVWVDAQTGTVIGGTDWEERDTGLSKKSPKSPKKLIKIKRSPNMHKAKTHKRKSLFRKNKP